MGDSGAPLWIEDKGKNTIVGVFHGGSVSGDDAVCGSMEESATKLNQEIIAWIRLLL